MFNKNLVPNSAIMEALETPPGIGAVPYNQTVNQPSNQPQNTNKRLWCQ